MYYTHNKKIQNYLAVKKERDSVLRGITLSAQMKPNAKGKAAIYAPSLLSAYESQGAELNAYCHRQPAISTSQGLFPSSSDELIDATRSSILRGECRTLY